MSRRNDLPDLDCIFNISAKLCSYSPGETVDSPSSGLLLDTSKDNPETFLVKLTPESSPKKIKNQELDLAESPTLGSKIERRIDGDKENLDVDNKSSNEVKNCSSVNKNNSTSSSSKSLTAKKPSPKVDSKRTTSNVGSRKPGSTTPTVESYKKSITNTTPKVQSRKSSTTTPKVESRILSQTDVKKPDSTIMEPNTGLNNGSRCSNISSGKKLDEFPREIHSEILKHLNTTDLCTVRCVSKSLKEAAEDARLWRNTRLVFKTPDLSRIRALLSAERFKLVKSVRVSGHIPANKAESILR